MNPLEFDHILSRIMSHLSHPIDLKNCRLVDQYWNSMATALLNDRGVSVVVSDENYQEFFQNRAKNIAGLNLEFNVTGQPDGHSRALLAMIKELHQDKSQTGTGSYCVKSISYNPSSPGEYLPQTFFWRLVNYAASDLEHLEVAGTLDYLNSVPGQENPSEYAKPITQFPVLKSVIFDIRSHTRTRQKPIPRIPQTLAKILNNSPALEEYKLVSDRKIRFDRLSAATQIWCMPTDVIPTHIAGIAGQLKTFGCFIMEGEGAPSGNLLALGKMTLAAICETRFQNLQTLAVLQLNNYLCTPEFFRFLTVNAKTLTSIEYTFIYSMWTKLVKFDVPSTEPPTLENVKYFGLYYRPVSSQWIDEPTAGLPPSTELIRQLQFTCLICPNLKILATDINVCLALVLFELKNSGHDDEDGHWAAKSEVKATDVYKKLLMRLEAIQVPGEPDFLESFFASDNRRKEKNLSVRTLKMTITNEILPFEVGSPSDFDDCMAHYWPIKFPFLHKLIVKVDMWPHNDVGLRLPGLLNIPGITHLEIINYCKDWIGLELAKAQGAASTSTASLAPLENLKQGLRYLRLSGREIMTGSASQRKRLKRNGPITWPDGVFALCDSFELLEEVVIDRRVFLSTIPVLGRTTTDKGVKIIVV